jgi:hypothetical protein
MSGRDLAAYGRPRGLSSVLAPALLGVKTGFYTEIHAGYAPQSRKRCCQWCICVPKGVTRNT